LGLLNTPEIDVLDVFFLLYVIVSKQNNRFHVHFSSRICDEGLFEGSAWPVLGVLRVVVRVAVAADSGCC
jgi:hypothetical protein